MLYFLAGAGGFETLAIGFGVLRDTAHHVSSYLMTCRLLHACGGHLYLWRRFVPPHAAEYVGKMSAKRIKIGFYYSLNQKTARCHSERSEESNVVRSIPSSGSSVVPMHRDSFRMTSYEALLTRYYGYAPGFDSAKKALSRVDRSHLRSYYSPIMTCQRIQQQIDRFLDEAEEVVTSCQLDR